VNELDQSDMFKRIATNQEEAVAVLKDIARDIRQIRLDTAKVINYMTDAESEVPEKMRRFIMYMHDVHDVAYMYEERGIPVPTHVLREMERCDDRYRHILEDLQTDTGTFERVRQEMSRRGGNRWDHSRILPKEKADETKTSTNNSHRDQG
jgi:hypothetical protein